MQAGPTALGAWSSKRAMVWGDWTGGRGPHTCGQNIGYRGNFTWSQLELLIDLHYRQEFYVHFLGRTHMESEGIILFVTNRNPEVQIWNLIFLSLFIWNESFACSNIYSIYSNFSISYKLLNYFLYVPFVMNLIYVHMLVIYLPT